jgi:hypothetical protein
VKRFVEKSIELLRVAEPTICMNENLVDVKWMSGSEP